MNGLIQDIRFTVRSLWRRPAYALLVLATLAFGLGLNVALFSVFNGVVLRPLANDREGRLVVLRQQRPKAGIERLAFSKLEIDDYRAQLQSVEALVEYHNMTFNLIGEGDPEEVQTGVVDARYFDVIGIRPILGRTFTDDEDRSGGNPVIVMSHRYWQQRFGAAPTIIGRTFRMNDRIHTVIGVLEPFTQFPADHDIYVPTSQCPIRASDAFCTNRNARMLTAFARMRRGGTVEGVRRDAAVVAGRLGQQYPDAYPSQVGHTATATLVKDDLVGTASTPLLLLVGATLFVLLIACANIASVTLALMSRREEELAIRATLGAGPRRLVRQVLTESLVLAAAGGALGLLLGVQARSVLVRQIERFSPRAAEASIDWMVAAAALGLTILTGLFCGLLPALSVRRRLFGAVREATGASAPRRKLRLQRVLVVVQVAVTFVLLAGCGLLARSLFLLQSADSGLVTENVLTMRVVTAVGSFQTPADQLRLWTPILERTQAVGGVIAASVSTGAPLSSQNAFGQTFAVLGDSENRRARADQRWVSPDYFRVVGAPVLEGRSFDERDLVTAPRVAVISRTFARTHFTERSPIGTRVAACNVQGVCDLENTAEVVGIVADVRQAGLDIDPGPAIYFPGRQMPFIGGSLMVRTTGDPMTVARTVVGIVRDVNPDLPVEDVRTLDELKSASLAPRRVTAVLLMLFALVALAVTLAGVFGVTAFSVGARQQELAIRRALGANGGRILSMVVTESMRLVGIGLAIGLVATLAMGRVLRGFVWGISPADPLTLIAAVAVFALTAFVGCYLPARRVTRIDPMIALKPA